MEYLGLNQVEEKINVFSEHIEYLQQHLNRIYTEKGIELNVCFRAPTRQYIHLYATVKAGTMYVKYDDASSPVKVPKLVGKPTDIKDKSSIIDGSYHPKNKSDLLSSTYSGSEHEWKTVPFLMDYSLFEKFGQIPKIVYVQPRRDTSKKYPFFYFESPKGYRYLAYPYQDETYKDIENSIKEIWCSTGCYANPKNEANIKAAFGRQWDEFVYCLPSSEEQRRIAEFYLRKAANNQGFIKGFILPKELCTGGFFPTTEPGTGVVFGKFGEVTVGNINGGSGGYQLKAVTNDLDIVTLVSFVHKDLEYSELKEHYDGCHPEFGYVPQVFRNNFLSDEFIDGFRKKFGFSIFMHGPECAFFRPDYPDDLLSIGKMVMVGPLVVYKIDNFFTMLGELERISISGITNSQTCSVIVNAAWLGNIQDPYALRRRGYDYHHSGPIDLLTYPTPKAVAAGRLTDGRLTLDRRLGRYKEGKMDIPVCRPDDSPLETYFEHPTIPIRIIVYCGGLHGRNTEEMARISELLIFLGLMDQRGMPPRRGSSAINSCHNLNQGQYKPSLSVTLPSPVASPMTSPMSSSGSFTPLATPEGPRFLGDVTPGTPTIPSPYSPFPVCSPLSFPPRGGEEPL